MKTCGKCKQDKELSEFHKDNTRKDKLHPYCKECLNQMRRDNREFKKVKQDNLCIDCGININHLHYNCIRCEGCKVINDRRKSKLYKSKISDLKKQESRVRWRLKNPERYKELMKKHNDKRKGK